MGKVLTRQCVIVLLFLLAISAPLLDMFCKIDPFPHLYENRPLTKRPVLKPILSEMQSFPQKYTAYFNDHFGFRNALIRANYFLRVRLLSTSPSKEVVLGKDGWFFFAGEGEIDDYRGITRYDRQLLEKFAATLELKRRWLAARGIRYLFVVAPNKSSVYGNMLPVRLNRIREKNGMDEFVTYLKQHTVVEILDLRTAMIAAKTEKRVYLKADTHWNNYGAFVAYQEMMKPISGWFPGVEAMKGHAFQVADKIGNGGDLACMVGGSEFQKEDYAQLTPVKKGRASSLAGINDITKTSLDVWTPDSTLPRALVFRDSFFASVAPFIAEHFSFSRYYWKPWSSEVAMEELVEEMNPDIVIEELVERTIKTKYANFIENPPSYIVAESFFCGKSKWSLEDLIKISAMATNDELTAKMNGKEVGLISKGTDPQLILPKLQDSLDSRLILKIVMKSKIDTMLQVYFTTSQLQNYSEKQSVQKKIKPGDNIIYISFMDKTISQLRLDPADKAGEFVIKELEIRSVTH